MVWRIAVIAGVLVLAAGARSYAADQAAETTAQEAVNAGNTVCPVSGEKVGSAGMAPATYEYNGTIYNFCCSACIETFKKDPQKYIDIVEEELKASQGGQHGKK